MRIHRFGPGVSAAQIRALVASPRAVADEVGEIVAAVRARGDAALAELTERFDGVAARDLRVPASALEGALAGFEPALEAALDTAIANVRQVAEATLRDPIAVALPEGQLVEIVAVPVRRAGAYVPGGYPSSVVMTATVAAVAGVDEIAIVTPPGPDGLPPPTVRATAALCGVDEVYAVGGAQSIAALAYGTEAIAAVDVIVGPGNAYVTEAKRQVVGEVGIDGLAGPSELVVVASGAAAELVALDLAAQAEHGPASLLALISADVAFLGEVASQVDLLSRERPTVSDAPLAVVEARSTEAAVALADAIAPEHLELVGSDAEALAGSVRAAGAVFVGRDGATAFGDYVAGSNHVLPTGGAARFAGPLEVATFRRTMARISLPPGSAARLAEPGGALARAEGFPVHAESMQRRS